jgi:BirA family biotin operon repressor/biotin-[acetyl-CoA-carboxylase] ligase
VYSDLERPGLRSDDLRRALVTPDGPWTDLRIVPETGSTNADVAALAREGAPAGLVLVAESQIAGRGRLDRVWTAPPRSGLTFSVLLRPVEVPASRWGWFPLLTGLAVCVPLARLSGLDVSLKWPNDVLVGDRKVGGILAERAGDALVIGMGLNVSLTEAELPAPTATSLALEGSDVVDRDPILRAVLRELALGVQVFTAAAGEPAELAPRYRAACSTIGRTVQIHLPGGRRLVGLAEDVDEDGRLVVRGEDGPETVGAGDVVHVR